MPGPVTRKQLLRDLHAHHDYRAHHVRPRCALHARVLIRNCARRGRCVRHDLHRRDLRGRARCQADAHHALHDYRVRYGGPLLSLFPAHAHAHA